MRNTISDTQNPHVANDDQPVSASIDPAAAAFEMLRKEVALTRRAVAGLAAERAAIDIPDYGETLGQILQANAITAKRLKTLTEAPALQLSAENLGCEIAKASEAARRRDEAALSDAKDALRDATGNLRGWISSARAAERQNTWLKATGAVGLVIGLILGAVIAGLLASATPERQGSPEQQAAALLGMSEEKAGEHLIRTASPKLWHDIVLGDRIINVNRDVLNRCQHRARKRPERCAIELPAEYGP